MEAHGISGRVLKWVKAWLTNRKQRTVLNGSFSSWASVISGIPQGSVLSPLLFVIYINEIDEYASRIDILLKFVYDTKLGNSALTARDCLKLQECLNRMFAWADTWGMRFNISKCKILNTDRNNMNHVYTMNGVPLEVTSKEWDIGVLATNTLKSSSQCAKAQGVPMQS